MNFFYDTETNGLPSFKLPSDDPSQPRIVQLSMVLEAKDERVVAAISVLIKPSSWKLPLAWSAEAEEAHGISKEKAEEYGVPAQHALALYLDLLAKGELVVAHNLAFDAKIMRASLNAEGLPIPDRKPEFCTMTKSTTMVNLPPTAKMMAAGMNRPKPPTLGEAYLFFTGQEFKGAHDGLADAYGCRRVFHALKDRTAPAKAEW